jgi:hypothetical protein
MPLFSISQDIDSSESENPKIEVAAHPRGWNRGISSFRQITPPSMLSLSSRVCLGLINPLGHPTLRQRHAQAAHYCETPCDI